MNESGEAVDDGSFWCDYNYLYQDTWTAVHHIFHRSDRKTWILYGVLHEECISETKCVVLHQSSRKKLIHQK